MILTPEETRLAEQSVFEKGIEAEDLMEEAGRGVAEAILRFFPRTRSATLYLGPGHNAGDALVAARYLHAEGWTIDTKWSGDISKAATLTLKKWRAFETLHFAKPATTTVNQGPHVLVDALLGIGARPGLRPAFRECTREVNFRRDREFATTVALDIPTGLNGTTGTPEPDAVAADFTLAIACAKSGLIADEAVNHVGRLEIIKLPVILPKRPGIHSGEDVSTAETLAPFLPRRRHDWHKGDAGRVAIIAGAPTMTGAAHLACSGAVRAGAGLVSLLAPAASHAILATRVDPEIMVLPWERPADIDLNPFDALAVGPGLGGLAKEWIEPLNRFEGAIVADADLLNALARDPSALKRFAKTGPRLFTPHPGEFSRLQPEAKGSRTAQARKFVKETGGTLLLKGARTLVTAPDRPAAYNPTGHSGMASGGMGDVLTGVCAGLAAQGMELYHAARLGSWVCGRAGELALQNGESIESTTPTAVLNAMGKAFDALREEN